MSRKRRWRGRTRLRLVIAHYVVASRQALDDAPMLRSLVDDELTYGLDQAEDLELLLGDGTGEHFTGLVPSSQAFSPAFSITGETYIDRIGLGLLQAELAQLPASGIVVAQSDAARMRLTKDGMGPIPSGRSNCPR